MNGRKREICQESAFGGNVASDGSEILAAKRVAQFFVSFYKTVTFYSVSDFLWWFKAAMTVLIILKAWYTQMYNEIRLLTLKHGNYFPKPSCGQAPYWTSSRHLTYSENAGFCPWDDRQTQWAIWEVCCLRDHRLPNLAYRNRTRVRQFQYRYWLFNVMQFCHLTSDTDVI